MVRIDKRLARRVVMLERGLRAKGYDEAVYAGPLREYEERSDAE
jgi:hypothetical protein